MSRSDVVNGRRLFSVFGKPFIFGLLLVGAFLLGPLAGEGPYATDVIARYEPPSRMHLLGTDHLGRDVLARVLTAGTLDLGIALSAAAVAFVVGTLLGAVSGYVGGRLDRLLMRLFDVWQSIPGILLGLLVIMVFGKGLWVLMGVVGLSFVPVYARMVRAEVLPQRDSVLVEAARGSGVSETKILLLYLLPRRLHAAVAYLPVQAAAAMGMTAGFGFIGLGVAPPAPEWGAMIAEGMSDLVFLGLWWTTLPAGLLLGLTSLLLFAFGDALAVWLDVERDTAVEPNSTKVSFGREVMMARRRVARHRPGPQPSGELNIRNLHVGYATASGSVPALRGVSLTLQPGEVTAVIGESGSGKTTLARTLLGALPRSASVTYDDVPKPRTAAFVQQEPLASLHPLKTIGRQIEDIVAAVETQTRAVSPRLPKGLARERTLHLLDRLQLQPAGQYYDRYPHELSGGQVQRVAVARALALRAELIVADEPTSQLDLVTEAEVAALLFHMTKELGACTLFVTHRLPLVAEIADRVAVLHDGVIVETGTVHDVWERPRHEHTRALLREMTRLIDVETTSGHHVEGGRVRVFSP